MGIDPMYYPYFRGKQFELLTIRESAEMLARSGFVPIIEPVKESLNGLQRALEAVRNTGGEAVVVVNPYHGDHREDGDCISELLNNDFAMVDSIASGILLKRDMSLDEISACIIQNQNRNMTFIHAGATEVKPFIERHGDILRKSRNIFFETHCGKLYRKHFSGGIRILLRDGFKRRRNADYPPVEPFSDLHATFGEEGMDGFGDFLTVGDDYLEGGGPAYAVALHVTFIDSEKDDMMYIYHFVSTTKDTPTDPAGKFAEALDKLIATLNSGRSQLVETNAIREFRELHDKGHFPGLGYIKKLSMKHHIETLAHYLKL